MYPRVRVNKRVMERHFRGKTCLITGASSGIGKALAEILIEVGAHLILIARNGVVLSALCEQAHSKGISAKAYVVDFWDLDTLNRIIPRIVKENDQLDYFFANAGKSIRRSIKDSLHRLYDFDRSISVNYRAHVALLLALYPKLRESHGTVVFSNSVSLLYPFAPNWSAYHASKSAMDVWLRTAKIEWKPDKIKIRQAYLPLVHTPMSARNKAYQHLPGYQADEAAMILIRLSLRKILTTYIPWWARLTAPLARLFRVPIEWGYQKYFHD